MEGAVNSLLPLEKKFCHKILITLSSYKSTWKHLNVFFLEKVPDINFIWQSSKHIRAQNYTFLDLTRSTTRNFGQPTKGLAATLSAVYNVGNNWNSPLLPSQPTPLPTPAVPHKGRGGNFKSTVSISGLRLWKIIRLTITLSSLPQKQPESPSNGIFICTFRVILYEDKWQKTWEFR